MMEEVPFTLEQRLITLSEYHKMVVAGIVGEDERIELLNGKMVFKPSVGSKHSICVKRLNRLFSRLAEEQAVISIQDPIQIPELSEPEPDVALLHPPLSMYEERHPLPQEVFLLIEVADSSLYKDQQIKLPLYASAGIPEVWIVNLAQQRIEVYTEPQDELYALRRLVRRGETIEVACIGRQVRGEDVLG